VTPKKKPVAQKRPAVTLKPTSQDRLNLVALYFVRRFQILVWAGTPGQIAVQIQVRLACFAYHQELTPVANMQLDPEYRQSLAGTPALP